jgi:hypothetical protein
MDFGKENIKDKFGGVGGRGYGLYKVLFKPLPAGTTITDVKHQSGQPVPGNDYKMAASKWIPEERQFTVQSRMKGRGRRKDG